MKKNNNRHPHLDFLTGLARPYKSLILLFLLLSCFTTALEGISISLFVPLLGSLQEVNSYGDLPFFLSFLTGLFQDMSHSRQLLISILAIISAVVFKNICHAAALYLGAWIGARVSSDLKLRGAELLLKAGLVYFHQVKTGEVVDQILSHTGKIKALFDFSVRFAINAITLAALFVLLLLFSWKTTLVALILFVLLTFLISLYTRRLSGLGHRNALDHQDLSSIILETISGIAVIQSFAKERYQFQKLRKRIERHRKSLIASSFANSFVGILTESIAVFFVGIVFFSMLFYEHQNSRLFLIQALPFLYILVRMVPHVQQLNNHRGLILSHMPYVRLVHELLQEEDKQILPDGDTPFDTLRHGIEFRQVAFSYGNLPEKALKDIDIFVPKGRITVIAGESGAGKSTLIGLLLRLFDPDQGEILVDGSPLKSFQVSSFRNKVGLIGQDVFVFNDTIKNNIAFGSEDTVSDEEIIEAAEKADAHHFITGLPKGYETVVGDRGMTLSAGQRQRITIARAFLKKPEILILDEATSSVDARSEKIIHNAFHQIRRGTTVIIVTHRLSSVRGVENIVVLKDGCILESGSEKDLMEQRGEYYHLLHV